MARDKVVSLGVVPLARRGEPQPAVVAYLEGLLDRAKVGDVQSVVTAWVQGNGKPAYAVIWGDCVEDYDVMGTAIMFAQHEFVCDAEETPLPLLEAPPLAPPEPET